MNNYYLHFERFKDGSLLHIGVCDDKEQVKIFDSTKYNNLLELSEDLLLYVSKNRTQDANLYLHNYKDDLRLMNKFLRKIEQFIIKADDNSDKNNGNNSGFTTINLIDSREIVNKDLKDFDEEFKLEIKNDIIINNNFFTQENYNKSVSLTDYTNGLNETEINNLSTYVDNTQTAIKNTIDLSPIILPTNITFPTITLPTITDDPIEDDLYIIQENVNLALQPNDDNLKMNPTNLIIESTYINTKILKMGLEKII